MLIEFTVLSPSPYSLELFAEISEETLDPEDMFDFLLYSDSETILDYGDTWPVDNNTPNGFSGVMNVSTSGVLQPGTYTLEVDANSFDQFGGGSSFDGLPLDLDFTLTLPTPSAAALLAIPAVMTAGRRRR